MRTPFGVVVGLLCWEEPHAPCPRGWDVPEDLRGTIYGLADDWIARPHNDRRA